MPKTTAVYLRVSKATGQDYAAQEPDLRRWAEANAGAGVVAWYRDRFTGKSMDRPGFARLMRDVAAGKVGRMVVWRLDRLGRTAKGLTALFDDLCGRRVNLISLRDGLDLETPAGRLMAHVLASVAQYETEVRAERILAGLEVAKAEGRKLGRPAGTGKRLRVTPEQAEQVRKLKGEGAQGRGHCQSNGPEPADDLQHPGGVVGASPELHRPRGGRCHGPRRGVEAAQGRAGGDRRVEPTPRGR